MKVTLRKKRIRLFALVRVGTDTRAGLLCTLSSVCHTASFPSCRGLAAFGPPAGGGFCQPRKVPVSPYRGMMAVNEDHLVIFQLPVLPDPVGVEHFHVRKFLGSTFFGNPLDAFAG